MKKSVAKLCLAGILFFGAISCSSNDDNHVHQESQLEKFKGTWTGTFTGEDEGTWNATIDETGKATGKLFSGNLTFDLIGQVDKEGEINATYTSGSTQVGTMEGMMNESTAAGKWESQLDDIEGTWTGTKN
ncbi:VCBS domain-containing protein [Paenimyroides aestuarii]|uniref:VCBS domain-containing protein n=1 Tax=Paenimyroides aestuarii TaxID=2968490 RepID=A0ABY5NVF8_9FLAO|nr:VCBS domain-containing protein [Paenimyroides aestuarii]UUV22414.1 VCBS domain-containing protein [Paenimyroides aestuarii]